MLREYPHIQQKPNSYRRLFSDDEFDLYLWFDRQDSPDLIGFQAVFHLGGSEHAMTWRKGQGHSFSEIDPGERGINRSPVLVAGHRPCPTAPLIALSNRLEGMDERIRSHVLDAIGNILAPDPMPDRLPPIT